MIDVTSHQLQTVKTILLNHLPDREVWVFGSRATGNAKQYSDLDLAVIGDTPLDLSQLASLEHAFDESELPFKVDLVDWATASDQFRQIIRASAVALI